MYDTEDIEKAVMSLKNNGSRDIDKFKTYPNMKQNVFHWRYRGSSDVTERK